MPDTALQAVPEAPRPRLLFVDDERRVLVSLKSIFRNDYEVRTTTSGGEALDILRDWEADVIISDQRMPQMTGVEVLKAAAEIRPRTTRVLLTGYSDLEAIIGSINESEVFRFVSKPWRRGDLNKTMEAAVRLSRQSGAAESAGEVAAESSTAEPQQDEANPSCGVLVLDANPSERRALLHTLDLNFTTYGAGSIDEALDIIGQHHVGVVMTESIIDGEPVTTLVNGLRQARPDLVYIIITHQPDAQHIIDLINYGQVYRVLRKPLKSSVVRGAVTLASRRQALLQSDPEQAERLSAGVAAMPEERQSTGVLTKLRRLFGF